MDSPSPTPSPRRAAMAFVFVTVLLDMIAVGIVVPVLPKLVKDFLAGDTVQAARVYGLFGTVWALMQFVFSPVLGTLSDRFGRRSIILLSNFGLGLDYILMALAPTLGWLFAGRVISGITAASVPAATAYIADVTPPEKRAAGFGMLGAAFGVGFVVGPAMGGLLGNVSPRLPFWVAAALSLLNAAYGLFVLPESLARDQRRSFAWKRANPVGSLRLLRSHPELLGLASANFLSYLAHDALPSTFVLYSTYRYGWTEMMVGLTLAGVGVAYGIVQGGLVGPMVSRLGERGALLTGLMFGVCGFGLFGLANIPVLFWAGIPFLALWGLSGPAAQGLMTARVAATEQGQLQGAIASLRGISGMIGPALFSFAFATSIAHQDWHFPGAAFVLASLLLAIAMLVVWRVSRPQPQMTAPLKAESIE